MGRMRDGAATLENIQAPFQSIQQELPFDLTTTKFIAKKKEDMLSQNPVH